MDCEIAKNYLLRFKLCVLCNNVRESHMFVLKNKCVLCIPPADTKEKKKEYNKTYYTKKSKESPQTYYIKKKDRLRLAEESVQT